MLWTTEKTSEKARTSRVKLVSQPARLEDRRQVRVPRFEFAETIPANFLGREEKDSGALER
jgi:hypothetical protein